MEKFSYAPLEYTDSC